MSGKNGESSNSGDKPEEQQQQTTIRKSAGTGAARTQSEMAEADSAGSGAPHKEPYPAADQQPEPKQTVIAVGASAGGLEALKEFLASLPSDIGNASVIIAQHLSPTHKSMMVQLLSKDARLSVAEAIHEQPVEPNTVYITPPDKQIIIAGGRIRLRKPDAGVGPKPSVDTLFYSLCDQQLYNAIGVILSGTGTDGAAGSRAIKECGGYVLVQDPATAKYDGMPQATIQTGMYDAVLAPEQMGAYILRHLHDGPEPLAQDTESIKTDEHLERIFEMLSDRTGTNFMHYKRATIARRLKKRLEALKIRDIPSYLAYLEANPPELDVMFQSILIGVTEFFRDNEAFEVLTRHLHQLLSEKSLQDPVRVWVPGCSTGEEAYSIAIIIHEYYGRSGDDQRIQIFATDIDEDAVRKGRTGIYSREALKNMPEAYVTKYFRKRSDGTYELDKYIRSMVLFSKHDITRNPPFLKLDLISCRNLLIYFGDVLQKQVMPIFHYALNSEGLLFLGKSETVGQFSDLFGTLDAKSKLFARRVGRNQNPIKFATFQHFRKPLASRDHVQPQRVREMTVDEMVRETLFNTYEHPYVVIDSEYNIVESNGDVRLYLSLPSGSMQSNLLRMMNHELQIEGRSVISKAITTMETVRSSIRKFLLYEKVYYVRITCKPMLFKRHAENLFIVIFERLDIEAFLEKGAVASEGDLVDNRVQELEHELAITKEHLQTYIEEIETSNEELQSLNEELQSSNEELQSSNEELETTNEELQSTNEEIQIAYSELDASKKEVDSQEQQLRRIEKNQRALLNNTLQGFLLIDKDYRLIEFNKTAEKLAVRLSGKALTPGTNIMMFGSSEKTAFWLNLIKKAFMGDVLSGEVKETGTDGETLWLSYNFTPIYGEENTTDVVSLGLIDITDKKTFSQRLSYTERLLHSIFDTTSAGICITDEMGRYVDVNAKYCDIYGYSRDELIGQSFTTVVPPEYHDTLQELHDRFIAGEKELDAEWVVERKGGRRIDVFATARLLEYEDGSRFKITSVHDITESKKYEHIANVTQEKGHIGGWELDPLTQSLIYTVETAAIFQVNPDEEPSLQEMYEVFNDEGALALERAVENALEKGKPFDVEIQAGIDVERWIRITCKPIVVHKRTIKLFGTVQDVTARRNYEAALIKNNADLSKAEAMLRTSLKEKEVLLAEIHHRVKNNLAVVSSMMQLQLMEESDEVVTAKLLDSISRIGTMAAIHEDLYSTTDFSAVTFTNIVGKLTDSVSSLLQGDRNISVQTELEDLRMDMNHAIPAALILNEAITNVYKHAFGGRDGKLLVRVKLMRDRVLVQVEDDGRGLPDNVSLDATESLGMQLIRTLTEQLEGTSRYERLDKGTRFTLDFPVGTPAE
ncbi:MAG: chemotaxis signal relay system bifunctional protein-glutamate methylesterase / methyltransferase Che [Bacteroidetes bacterium HLUCCA01]|nr:MAG: chemotaxis signal relay system bifunctional protein-glutamate methylesterase / methyltransferase Che [Bacteroidetes bacterium HLUCCA01]